MPSVEALLARGRAAGIRMCAERGELILRRPRRHESLVLALASRKAEVMAAMWPPIPEPREWIPAEEVFGSRDSHRLPPRPCRCCGGRRWWRLRDTGRGAPGGWICARCHPSELPEDQIERREVAR